MDKGWVKVYRKLLSNPLWLEKPFSKGQAFVDLTLLANHEPNIIILSNEELEIKRGQRHTSELKLAERWGWSRKKVHAYLKQLERLKMVTTVGTPKGTTITVENYEIYQGCGTTDGTTVGTFEEHQRNNTRALKGTQTRMKKNIKNEKNIIYSPAPYIPNNNNEILSDMEQEHKDNLLEMRAKRDQALSKWQDT